jgi:peptidyl-prolyl cis-trans isomerase SurA
VHGEEKMLFKTYLIKIIFNIFLLLILSGNYLYSFESKIVVKVDNEIITNLDIENETRYLKALNPKIKNMQNTKVNLIAKNSLIREKIKKNEILRYVNQIKLDPLMTKKLIKERYTRLNFTKKDDFLKYLTNYQINISKIEYKIAIEALWNQLIYSKFFSKVKIDKISLKNQIDEFKDKDNKSYLLSEIVFKVSDKKNLKKKYEEIKKEILDNGFESAALINSISESSEFGGKLGWIKEDALSLKIKKDLSKIEKNYFTKPIFTPNGYLILKVNDIRFIKKKIDRNKELSDLINYKTNQQLNRFSNNYFNKIKNNSIINEL